MIREAFYKVFNQLQNIYTILSPDAFLTSVYNGAYRALVLLYGLIRNAYADRIYVDRELTAKTRELLQQHTGQQSIHSTWFYSRIECKHITRSWEVVMYPILVQGVKFTEGT